MKRKSAITLLLAVLSALTLFCILILAGCGPSETGRIDLPTAKPTEDIQDLPRDTVEVTIVINGNSHSDYFTEGDVVYFAGVFPDYEVSLDPGFSTLLAETEGTVIKKGLTVYMRDKEQLPAEVSVTFYDVAKDGSLEMFEVETMRYGSVRTFNGAGFVLYSDPACTQEVDPNLEMTVMSDLSLYRKDNLDRKPVFLRVHYYTNGTEDNTISEISIFFRGELIKSGTYINGDTRYAYYRDANKTQKFIEEGNTYVVRDSDDKLDVYAFKEDPSVFRVTFYIGEDPLGTVLLTASDIIGEGSAASISGNKTVIIRDCSAMNQHVTHDMDVIITDCVTIPLVGVTEHLCYGGDVKYTYTNYVQFDEEYPWEVREDSDPVNNYYLDVNCTQVYTGIIKSSRTFYRPIYVDYDRYVGNR